MKKSLLLIILLCFSLFIGCRDWNIMGIRGNGKITSEKRNIDNFTQLELGGAFNVEVRVGKEESIEIIGEENLLKYIRTNVEGDKLVIDTKKNISPRKELKIKITVPSLEYIELGGACDVFVDNISGEKFSVDLSGAGSIELIGKVEKFTADISGAASLRAKNLKALNVEISMSGASNADVYASESIDASVSGVGSISYYGNPKDVHSDVSGIGSISRK